MRPPFSLNCPEHGLILEYEGTSYLCPSGCRFPIRDDIPRFVAADNYAESFGYQWKTYRQTQLDSFSGTSISRDRLRRLMGGSFDGLRGRRVLEAGCGAGRFTEVLLAEGAKVFSVDLSAAVEANYENFHDQQNYFVCQADILELPLHPGQFDVVVCIGVLQATPDPEAAISALIAQLKPSGTLVIDHYSRQYPVTFSRRMLRSLLLKMPKRFSIAVCKFVAFFLWPFHHVLWKARRLPLIFFVRTAFLGCSPFVDYHDAYPQLGPELMKVWGTLDMHDTVTDHYKHLRTQDEIRNHLERCGMAGIETRYAGNGVEALAVKPLPVLQKQ